MWLLNSHTFQLEHFEDETQKYGRYAILSHVWLAKELEVSFQDLLPPGGGQVAATGAYEKKAGWAKIEQTCRRAVADRLDYCWIDTCCIDKSSSAELSEAINSMYRWYYQAKVCYAYLADVPEVALCDSTWFTRGWTLQELIAPGYVEFYDNNWELIGSKISMLKELAEITRIDSNVLRDRETLQAVSVAARMAWASDRSTTRIEDRAYSLMGIFDVNLPMLYGEGEKAFARLQEEIIRTSTDHSIIVWQAWEDSHLALLMAPSPYGFRRAHNIVSWSNPIDEAFQLANKGLRISLPAVRTAENPELLTAILNCRYSDNTRAQIAVILRELPHERMIPAREVTSTVCELTTLKNDETGRLSTLRNLDRRHLPSAKWEKLLILKEKPREQREDPGTLWTQKIIIRNNVSQLKLLEVWPLEAYDSREGSVTFVSEHERGYMIFGERDGKKKFSVAFGQELHSGRAEPKISLARYNASSSLHPDAATVFRALQSSRRVKIEFKKGLSELFAEVEKRLDANGDLEWSISLRLEHYSDHLKSQLMHLVHREHKGH